MATSGALMLYCSRYGPMSYVPGATEIYLNELAQRCSDHENIHSISYDIVLACDYHDDGMSSHVYNDLGSYLTWRWFRVNVLNRLFRRDIIDQSVATGLEGRSNDEIEKLVEDTEIGPGVTLGSQFPQFYPVGVSTDGPTKNVACVELVRSFPGFDTKNSMNIFWGSLSDDFLVEVFDTTYLDTLRKSEAALQSSLDLQVGSDSSSFIP